MAHADIHVGMFLSVLFVYAFLPIIFAVPYLLHFLVVCQKV